MALDVLILRDPRESLKKCSLTPLRGRPGIRFVDYRPELVLEAGGRLLLHHEGDELGPADAGPGGGQAILLVDCSWRRLPSLLRTVTGDPTRRRLPPLRTAYPRTSRLFQDPAGGLASIEALYGALALLGDPRADLLDSYRWREEFLAANPILTGGGLR